MRKQVLYFHRKNEGVFQYALSMGGSLISCSNIDFNALYSIVILEIGQMFPF